MNSHIYVIFRNFVTNVFFVNIYVIMKQNNIYTEYYPFILKIWQVVSSCLMQLLWPLDLRQCLIHFGNIHTCTVYKFNLEEKVQSFLYLYMQFMDVFWTHVKKIVTNMFIFSLLSPPAFAFGPLFFNLIFLGRHLIYLSKTI